MAQDFISSDKTTANVSGNIPVEIARGNGTLSGFTSVTGGWIASTSIKLDFMRANKFVPEYLPEIKVMHTVDYGSMMNGFYYTPYCNTDYLGGGGVFNSFSYYVFTQGVSPTEMDAYLTVEYFTKFNDVGDRRSAFYTHYFTWVAYSNKLWP